jgi:hypothetical protein
MQDGAAGENPSRQSFCDDRPTVLPQLVVYGNPARSGRDQLRKRQLSANSGVWVLFGLKINTQFHIHKTYVTTRQ